jgi:molybdopterin-binding protein
MKLSARSQLPGRIVEVREGSTTAHVRIDIGNGVIITSSSLAVGDQAIAVINRGRGNGPGERDTEGRTSRRDATHN